jgi:hypothetical protein
LSYSDIMFIPKFVKIFDLLRTERKKYYNGNNFIDLIVKKKTSYESNDHKYVYVCVCIENLSLKLGLFWKCKKTKCAEKVFRISKGNRNQLYCVLITWKY